MKSQFIVEPEDWADPDNSLAFSQMLRYGCTRLEVSVLGISVRLYRALT